MAFVCRGGVQERDKFWQSVATRVRTPLELPNAPTLTQSSCVVKS